MRWNMFDNNSRKNYPTFNFLESIDPYEINCLSLNTDIKKSLFLTICPEEPTPDIMSVFMLLKKRMEYELGENSRMHIVTCTGSNSSVLYQLASQEGYKSFDVYENISGCFSILSPCGILPMSLLGINTEEFLAGVEDVFSKMLNPNIHENISAQTALIHYLLYSQKNKNDSVFMPYLSRLNALTEWCCRIELNTHCKTFDKEGNPVDKGKIPRYSERCTDYHSLFNILNQSTNDKMFNIFKIENFDSDNIIPQIFDYTPVGYLGGKTFSELLNAKLNAIKMTLTDYQRPNITISIPKITPYYLGQFTAFYMKAILIQASLYNIDPFAKPDSDILLNYIYAQMGRYGYEATYREMQNKLNKIL